MYERQKTRQDIVLLQLLMLIFSASNSCNAYNKNFICITANRFLTGCLKISWVCSSLKQCSVPRRLFNKIRYALSDLLLRYNNGFYLLA